MKRTVIFLTLVVILSGCRRETTYSYAEALAFQAVSSDSETLVDVAGNRDGPFVYQTCTVLADQGEEVTSKSQDGSQISWTRPTNMVAEARCYSFRNNHGRVLLVIKEVANK